MGCLDAHFAPQLDLAAAARYTLFSAGGEEIELPGPHAFRDQSLLLSCHALLLPARATFITSTAAPLSGIHT